MARQDLESLGRDELITRAEALGVVRPQVLTRVELIDTIVQRTVADPGERRRARGFLGRVRDMLASMVERGLNLPDGEGGPGGPSQVTPSSPTAVATVTLAEIYAAQGHTDRALTTLDEVLAREPDHEAARALRKRLLAAAEAERAAFAERTASAPASAATERSPLVGPAASAAAAAGPNRAPARAGRAPEPPVAPEPHVAPGPPPPAEGPLAGSTAQAALAPGRAAPLPPPLEPRPTMLDDAPLPHTYGVDEAVVLPVDPTTAYVYWEVRPEVIARARAGAPLGHLVVRLFAARREATGDESVRDIRPDDMVGDYFVHGLPAGASLRAALGWVVGDHFEPLAWSSSQSTPRAAPAASVASRVVVWSLEAAPPPETLRSPPPGMALAIALAEATPGYDPLESPFGDETEGGDTPELPRPEGPRLGRGRLVRTFVGSSEQWAEEAGLVEQGARGPGPGPDAPARGGRPPRPRLRPLGSSDLAPVSLGASDNLPLRPRR